ncbi:glycopeptide resistance accessory protein VanW [Anaerorhabdus sp.]
MKKRITQKFPFLLPLRQKQRQFCFYMKMKMDGNQYACNRDEHRLPYLCASIKTPMYNYETGFDFKYQENKVFNLKLAALPINWLLIRPGETFSFWKLVHQADKFISYKEGLTVVNGETIPAVGGGLCQLSNLLFQLFLHSPLTIVERKGHRIKEFPELSGDCVKGIDATIADGWIDLKVKNNSEQTFQLGIYFDDTNINGYLYSNEECKIRYEIENRNLRYYKENDTTVEKVEVWKKFIQNDSGKLIKEEFVYENQCVIGYDLEKYGVNTLI